MEYVLLVVVVAILAWVAIGFAHLPVARLIAATFLGFLAGFLPTFLIALDQTSSAECDGVCLDRLGEFATWASSVGAVTAVIAGVFMWRHLRRKRLVADGSTRT